jgi:hypothetical protein
LCLSFLLACQRGPAVSTPTTPTPNAPASNQPPQIASATITPSLGVFGLTTFTAHVDARDPDAGEHNPY